VSAMRQIARSQTPPRPYPGPRGCHFIEDDGPWMRRSPAWCGAPVQLGQTYCERHRRICYTTVPRRYHPRFGGSRSGMGTGLVSNAADFLGG